MKFSWRVPLLTGHCGKDIHRGTLRYPQPSSPPNLRRNKRAGRSQAWTPRRALLIGAMHALTLGTSTQAAAQQSITLEERFQDIFLTAGYSTAFGAAFGTALLAWTANPTENLKYVAIGASLGFIGGTLLGTYVVLQPLAEIPPSVPGDPDGQATGLRYPATVSVDRQHPTGAGKFHLSGFPEKTSANTPKGPQLKLSPLVSWDRAPKVAGLTAQVTLARF